MAIQLSSCYCHLCCHRDRLSSLVQTEKMDVNDVDENQPMEDMLPKMNPFRIVDENSIPDDDLPF